MRRKLSSNRGETLVEVMVSLVIVILIISMLPMALETAARINAQVKDIETICPHSLADSAKDSNVTAALYDSSGMIADLSVQGYLENGFTYYVKD